MKALKGLVIVMGALIVAGLGVVAYTVAKRAGAPADGADAPFASAGRAPPAAFGEVGAPIPPGYEVTEMLAEGDRLMLRLEGDGKVPRILVLDLRSGRTLGTVVLDATMVRPPR